MNQRKYKDKIKAQEKIIEKLSNLILKMTIKECNRKRVSRGEN